MGRTVGIKAVAEAAGVSITTVSHALNGKGRLSDETRRHVREVADRLGYQPSGMARALAGGRSGMLAMLLAGAKDFALKVGDFDYFLQLMNGAASGALQRGFSLTMLQADDDLELPDGLPLDGAIVIDPIAADPVVAALSARGVPVVTTVRVVDGPADACWVDKDEVAGPRGVPDPIAGAGAPRVALLTAPPLASYAFDAQSAYLSSFSEPSKRAM